MLLSIPTVLTAEQVQYCRERLAITGWIDGRVTAGYQGYHVKNNHQLPENSPIAQELGELVLAAIERNPLFISAALPLRVYPPMFNCYTEGMYFGNHIDNAVRLLPHNALKIRTDVSATLFLANPDEYEGGELLIEDTYGVNAVKLAAGDMVVYPSTSLHRVATVTRGARIASFFWIQSMIRDDAQRAMLFDMDTAIQRLNQTNSDETARVQLTGCYHNLLRMWADV
ncbi:Fe2+-dependent dioxygenase [Beggiatoa leptomitoformis]|uniref:Fe2+-dependent dioxygenase n=1 Tax=Beggiatoa leptomitoformis TaxID=288004 RepID=A0A2N9YCM6_9GAMM|nr:Fe2+-dependent dioxygenase [Beggiatoa leptomitoformis]ALG66529.1 Fe2+-dependent dioxygenase [Beggiatoa leptomitoformis]AUI68174.1 Fe2+-dependent dioxygenase [Beggiatoa leptomitoformis]